MQAEHEFLQQFRQREVPVDIPVVTLPLDGPVWVCRLLSAAGLVESNGEARRLIQQGGLKLNGEKLTDPDAEVEAVGELVVQAGKRRFARILFQ